MQSTLDSTLAWWIAGSIRGLVIQPTLARVAERVSEGAESQIPVVKELIL